MQCTARVIRHFPGPFVKYLEEPHQRGDPFGRGHTRPHGNTGCAQEVSVTVQVFLELSSPPGHWLLVQPIITLLSTPSATAPHTLMAQAPAPRCEMSWAALAALTSSPGTVRWTPELSPAETPPPTVGTVGSSITRAMFPVCPVPPPNARGSSLQSFSS